jgi:hypothetical protein
MSAPLAIATVATPDRLADVRVLATSLAEHHPDVPFFAAVPGTAAGEPFTPLALEPPPGLPAMGACCVLKARVLEHLLDAGHEAALFLDADTAAFGPLDDLFAAVRAHAMVLTPHLVAPALEHERLVLVAGTYNAGLVGVRDRPDVRRFLAWWQARIEQHPVSDPGAGIHYDQRWLDLAPGYVEDLHVLRAPDVNVGHWRLPTAVCPRLAHFSGFDPVHPELVSRHAPGLRAEDAGAAGPLHAEYARRLSAASQGAPTVL